MIIIDHLEANITNNKIAGFDLDWTLIKPKEDRLCPCHAYLPTPRYRFFC